MEAKSKFSIWGPSRTSCSPKGICIMWIPRSWAEGAADLRKASLRPLHTHIPFWVDLSASACISPNIPILCPQVKAPGSNSGSQFQIPRRENLIGLAWVRSLPLASQPLRGIWVHGETAGTQICGPRVVGEKQGLSEKADVFQH